MSYFSNINDAISYIESKRSKRTLEQFQDTLKKHNINTDIPNVIHVAGTNGKGSTVTMIKDLLMHHGFTVGTFTSPYMICHNDRICINNQMIDDTTLLQYVNTHYQLIEDEGLSMFEIDVLFMLLYFTKKQPDFCIIEVGIGGLLDKTNVLSSKVAVITNIGYDHEFMLGNTLEQIASHKAGIIKEYQKCYTTETNPNLQNIFIQEAIQKNSIVHLVSTNTKYDLNRMVLYQRLNISLAIAVIENIIKIEPEKVQAAIDAFYMPGRFEKIGKFYIDGAHNVSGIQAIVTAIEEINSQSLCIIFSALQDKDRENMLSLLSKYKLYQVYFDDERCLKQGVYYKEQMIKAYQEYEHIVVVGSMHFASVARKYASTLI